LALLLLLSPFIACLGIFTHIWWSTKDFVFDQAGQVPKEPVAVVFGAGVLSSGKPSLILQDRLDGAIALYRQSKVGRLLMSGDNRTKYYNEP
jgi:vancomycin permeability regulator SanA